MVMKDKLYKNYHKGSYYTTRRITFFGIAFISGLLAISIPTYINSLARETVKAEKDTTVHMAARVSPDEMLDLEYTFNLEKTDFIR